MADFQELFMKEFERLKSENKEIKTLCIDYKGKKLWIDYPFTIKADQKIRLILESTDSDVRQGVELLIKKGTFVVNGIEYKQRSRRIGNLFHFWAEEFENGLDIELKKTDGMLKVINTWEHTYHTGNKGIVSGSNGAAMIVEELPNGYRFRCNDWEPDEDFDDIVFRIELLDDRQLGS